MKTNCAPPTLSLVLLLATLPVASSAQTLHTLRPYQQQPGEVVRIETKSNSPNGTITVTEGEKETKGTLVLSRERKLERRVSQGADGMQLSYTIVSDVTKKTEDFEGRKTPTTITSSLTGKTVIGTRGAEGNWRFAIPDATPNPDQTMELSELDAYENHSLFPNKAVRLKESWKIKPQFLIHLTEAGIGLANVDAIARLDEIKEIDGEQTAIITLTIETVATEGTSAEGRGSGTAIKASGELHVAMDTMFDKKLVVYGSRQQVWVENGIRSKVHSPVRIEVTKTRGK